MKSIAQGRSPKKELAAARRHLAECPRCRAAVVAAAHGVQGPGDTVLLKRGGHAVIPRGFKLAAVAVSVVAATAAWRFGGASKSAEPPRVVEAHPVALEPALVVSRSEPLLRSGEAQRSPAPSEPEREIASSAEPALGDMQHAPPTVRVLPALPSDELARSSAMSLAPSVSPHSPPRPPASSSRQASARVASKSSSTPPAPAKRSQKADEYDFGIDEESASSKSSTPSPSHRLPIRSTLD